MKSKGKQSKEQAKEKQRKSKGKATEKRRKSKENHGKAMKSKASKEK